MSSPLEFTPPPKIRVLLVDDHLMARSGMRLMLSTAEDIEVAAEADCAAAALAQVRMERFNVALVDVGMPDRNGIELIRLLRAEQPQLAVLVVSMYSEDIYAVRAFRNGAAGYLTKNTPDAVLVAAVRKAATGGKFVSENQLEVLAGAVSGGAGAPHELLSDREFEVFKLIAAGESLVRIAELLHVSPSTVTSYRGRILEKTRLKTNAQIARYALEHGLLL